MNKTLIMLALTVGIIFFACSYAFVLPLNTYIEGVNVSGMTRPSAINCVREQVTKRLQGKQLHICFDESVYTYEYPEFNFYDDLVNVTKNISKSGRYSGGVYCYLNGIDDIICGICGGIDKSCVQPYANFNISGAPFTYHEGHDGIICDRQKLKEDIVKSLNGNFEDVHICTYAQNRTLNLQDIKEQTELIYSFTTYFDGNNANRASNIKLAASRLNGSIIKSGKVLSFNDIVGDRTLSNGFKSANIISQGKYVQGIGGGVCQVSTTLYNAAILSGLKVCEYHPHSLAVGYVAPSRDAMVSYNYCDLKIKNPYKYPIYVRLSTALGSVTCSIYGKSEGVKYSLKSITDETIPFDEEITFGDEDKIISFGHSGIKSRLMLLADGGTWQKLTCLRTDTYAPIRQIVQRIKPII